MSASFEKSTPRRNLRRAPGEARQERGSQPTAEQARQAVAGELHDTICQSLSGLQLLAKLAERKAARQCPEMVGDLVELRELIATASGEVQRLVRSLRGEPGEKPAPDAPDFPHDRRHDA